MGHPSLAILECIPTDMRMIPAGYPVRREGKNGRSTVTPMVKAFSVCTRIIGRRQISPPADPPVFDPVSMASFS